MKLIDRRDGGLTLIELLISVSLGTILIGIITVVWMQSSRIVTETVERLEVYENLRTVLDAVERDLSNSTRTVDMEFWNDANQNGRYDTGEQLKLADGSFFRDPRDKLDPLKAAAKKEFFDADLNAVEYFFAPTVSSPVPWVYARPDGAREAHWRDEVYVRSFSMAGGINRSALVHYRLVGNDQGGRASLRRRVWYLNKDGQIAFNATNPDQSTDRASILTDGILDLKVGFYFKESQISGNGVLYHVRPDGNLPGETAQPEVLALLDKDAHRFAPCFGTLPTGVPSPLKKTKRPASTSNAISFMYEGWGKFEFTELQGVRFRPLARALSDPPPAVATPDYVGGYDTFDFPGVRLGDKIYIFDAADDDAQVNAALQPQLFPDRYLTVQSVVSESARGSDGSIDPNGPKAISIQFAEVIDYYRLKGWLMQEQPTTLSGSDVAASNVRVPRTITQSFDAKYRVGFLPSAFVVRLSYDDRRHHRVIPFERVIRLLSQ